MPSTELTFLRCRRSKRSFRRRLGDAILDRAGARAVALPGDVFSIFLDLLAVFFISLLLLTNWLRIRDFVLSLTDFDHRRRTGFVLDRSWLRIGGYCARR